MNSAQLAKYHVLKKQWADARTARGMQADKAALDALQLRTIGRACSSTTFSQLDLDKMVAAFLAESKPADFNAQMTQQEQVWRRKTALEKRCFDAGAKFITGNDRNHIEWKTISYIRGICKKMGFPETWPIADEQQFQKITGIMERQAQQAASKARTEEKIAVEARLGSEHEDAHALPPEEARADDEPYAF